MFCTCGAGMVEAGVEFGETKWECPVCGETTKGGGKTKVYICPECLGIGYGAFVRMHFDLFGRRKAVKVYDSHCPSCGDTPPLVVEIPEELKSEIKEVYDRAESEESVALAILLLVASKVVEAKSWIREDYTASFHEYHITVGKLLAIRPPAKVFEAYDILSKELKKRVREALLEKHDVVEELIESLS